MINILVPTDFSPAAKKAVEYAIHVAKRVEGTLTLLHIYQIPLATARGAAYGVSPDTEKEVLLKAEGRLIKLENEMPGLKEIKYLTKYIPMYWLFELPDIIKEQNADLIIMGTNGASALGGMIFGSNTAKVFDKAKCPVIAVPVDAECAKIEKVAFAYDKEFVENLTTFDFVLWFTKQFNALLDIFHVKPAIEEEETVHQKKNREQLRNYLEGMQHTYVEIPGQDVEENINKYMVETNIDLLVMMHRSRSLFERLFRRSFTIKMAYHTTIPLLVIPEKFVD